ncbi:MAG: hypothetical protein ACPHM0_04675, partial [Flavobacteriales bacterium]
MRLHICERPAPDLCFGFANTKDVCELTAMMTNQYLGCGSLEREAELTEMDELQYYYCAIRCGNACVYLNSRMLFKAACPPLQGSVVIKFGMVDSTLLITIGDLKFQTPLPAEGVCAAECYFPVLVIYGSGWL